MYSHQFIFPCDHPRLQHNETLNPTPVTLPARIQQLKAPAEVEDRPLLKVLQAMPFAHRHPETELDVVHLQLRKVIVVVDAAVVADLEPGRVILLHEAVPVPKPVPRRRRIEPDAFFEPRAHAVPHAHETRVPLPAAPVGGPVFRLLAADAEEVLALRAPADGDGDAGVRHGAEVAAVEVAHQVVLEGDDVAHGVAYVGGAVGHDCCSVMSLTLGWSFWDVKLKNADCFARDRQVAGRRHIKGFAGSRFCVCSFMTGLLSSRLSGHFPSFKRRQWPFQSDEIAAIFSNLAFVLLRSLSFFQYPKKKPTTNSFMHQHSSASGSNVRLLLCLSASYTSLQKNPSRLASYTAQSQPNQHITSPSISTTHTAPFPLNPNRNEHGRTTPTTIPHQHGHTPAQPPTSYLPTQSSPSSSLSTSSSARPKSPNHHHQQHQQQRHRTASRPCCFDPRAGRELGPHARLLRLAHAGGHRACGYRPGDDERASGWGGEGA